MSVHSMCAAKAASYLRRGFGIGKNLRRAIDTVLSALLSSYHLDLLISHGAQLPISLQVESQPTGTVYICTQWAFGHIHEFQHLLFAKYSYNVKWHTPLHLSICYSYLLPACLLPA